MGWNRDDDFYQRLLKYSAKCKNLIVFQMTEMAVRKALFREKILERISRLTLALAAVTPGSG